MSASWNGSLSKESTYSISADKIYGLEGDASALINDLFGVVGAGITISPTTTTLKLNQTQQFTATNQNGDNITNQANWSTSDPTIATIDSTGLLTALKVGTVMVTVEAGGVIDTAEVTISQEQPNFTLRLTNRFGNPFGYALKLYELKVGIYQDLSCTQHSTGEMVAIDEIVTHYIRNESPVPINVFLKDHGGLFSFATEFTTEIKTKLEPNEVKLFKTKGPSKIKPVVWG